MTAARNRNVESTRKARRCACTESRSNHAAVYRNLNPVRKSSRASESHIAGSISACSEAAGSDCVVKADAAGEVEVCVNNFHTPAVELIPEPVVLSGGYLRRCNTGSERNPNRSFTTTGSRTREGIDCANTANSRIRQPDNRTQNVKRIVDVDSGGILLNVFILPIAVR